LQHLGRQNAVMRQNRLDGEAVKVELLAASGWHELRIR
jgi:hypothetical protein